MPELRPDAAKYTKENIHTNIQTEKKIYSKVV